MTYGVIIVGAGIAGSSTGRGPRGRRRRPSEADPKGAPGPGGGVAEERSARAGRPLGPAEARGEASRSPVAVCPPTGCAAVIMDLFAALLAERGLPLTRQRGAVAQVLFRSGRHLSAADIGRRLQDRGETVGSATIYRTLNLLVHLELAVAHDFHEGLRRYEMVVGSLGHAHLVCTGCGGVEEFHQPELERIQRAVAREHGFELRGYRLLLCGLCAPCSGKEAPEGGGLREEG